jgi:hypothetical protein
MKKNLPFFTLALFCFSMSFAQSGLWTPIAENDARSAKVNRNVTPTSYRLYRLNLSAMRNTLAAAPLRGNLPQDPMWSLSCLTQRGNSNISG